MLDALGVAGDLRANDAQGVAVVARTRDPADAAVGQERHLQRAGARAIVRAGGLGSASHQLLHETSLARRPVFSLRSWLRTPSASSPSGLSRWRAPAAPGGPGPRNARPRRSRTAIRTPRARWPPQYIGGIRL